VQGGIKMDRAAILGVYDYIGYSLCQFMLDDGMEIDGVHIASKQENYFTEEKRMEIGRNANFSEVVFKEWSSSGLEDLFIICLYDHFREGCHGQEAFIEKLVKKLETVSISNQRVIIVLPARFAEKKKEYKFHKKLSEFLKEKRFSVLECYLPTVYGPWQPEEYFFQQSINYINGGKKTPQITKWEWTHDALFIDDAAFQIMKMAEDKEEGSFLFASGKKNLWLECAEHLLEHQNEMQWRKTESWPEIKDSIRVVKLHQNERIAAGLSKQEEHYSRIQESKV
jgi:hypothetical protein